MGRAALTALLLTGCGYRFIAPASTLPAGLKSVHVPVFVNATPEAGVEALCTQSLRDVYLRNGLLGGEGADGRIEGTVVSVSSVPLTVSPRRLPNYRLAMVVTLKLMRGTTPIHAVTVTGGEEFPGGADMLWSETWRGAAMRRVIDNLMREASERLATGW
ncbi:MAG: LptE family protein [Archangium sp.]|nr:LptE family protein [Archangium sp.]